MHWNEEYYLLGCVWHMVPCLFWPHPLLVPKSSVGTFKQPCPFHLIPTPCYDILFYHEDVNRTHTHTPPGTLHGISRGSVCTFQRIVVLSSLLGWLRHKDEGTKITWNFKNCQTHWYRVISQDWIFSNTNMRTSILARCIHTFFQNVSKFLPLYAASHQRKQELQSSVE